jgi:hypothetical protein
MDIPYFLVCAVVGSFFMVAAALLVWFLILVFGLPGIGMIFLGVMGIWIAALIGQIVLTMAGNR